MPPENLLQFFTVGVRIMISEGHAIALHDSKHFFRGPIAPAGVALHLALAAPPLPTF